MARVRLPILVTKSKLLVTDEDGDITTSNSIGESVMDFAADVLLTITSRESGGGQVDVYSNETGGTPLGPEAIKTDSTGRFEGWIERGRINVVATVGSLSFSDDFDLAPASDGSVDSAWIAASAVTEEKIDEGAVTNEKLGAGSVTLDKIADNAKDQAQSTPSLRSLGTGANQAAPGNDARFVNSRTPSGPAGGDLSGTYPNPQIGSEVITNADVSPSANISESKLNLASDSAAGTASRRTLGTGANQAAAGNDGRFPTTAQKAALSGADTGSSPSETNPYVTKDDSRFGLMIGPENLLDGSNIAAESIPASKIEDRDGSNAGINLNQLAQEVLNVVVPVGAILPFGGSTAPAGFLICNGSSFLVSLYPALDAVLGGVYGRSGTGPSQTFAVPNLQGKFPLGTNASYPRNATGGGTYTEKLSLNQIPPHSHTANLSGSGSTSWEGSHRHNTNGNRATNRQGNLNGTVISNLGGDGLNDSGTTSQNGNHQHTVSVTVTGTTNSAGGTSSTTHNSHNNMPPYIAVNYIIKF